MSQKKIKKLQDYVTTVTILESLSDAIFILSIKGAIEYANKSALKLLQIEQQQLIGKYIDEFLIDESFKIKSYQEKKPQKIDQILERFNEGVFENIEAALINDDNIIPVILNFS